MSLTAIQRRREERSIDNRLHFGQVTVKWSVQPQTLFETGVFGFEMDLDLGAFLLDSQGEILDMIHYQKNRSNCGAIVFDQDSHDKQKIEEKLIENKLASETIAFDLGIVNKRADYVVFVGILNNDSFDQLKDAIFTIENTANHQVLLSNTLTPDAAVSGCIFAALKYHSALRNWSAHWIEEYVIAGAFTQMRMAVQRAALLL